MGSAPAAARLLGLAAGRPYGEAVAQSRLAAEAVLQRAGAESCLIGKLTNALLALSASCEAADEHSALCALANRAAVTPRWTLLFADATAQQLLTLSAAPSAAISETLASPVAPEQP